MNIVSLIFENAETDAIALIADDQSITYGELRSQVDIAATRIKNVSSARIGLDCPNGIAHVVLALAIVQSGKCLVPLATELVMREREEVVRQTGIDAILKEDGSLKELPRNQALDFDEVELAALHPAFIRFSSGTTGKSKGVVLSHESLLERIQAANNGLRITPTDRVVWILPMAHHFAVSIILYLWRGATTIIVKSHLAEEVLTVARRHGGTVLYGSPFHHGLLAAEPSQRSWPELRLAVSTAAPLPSEIAIAFYNRFGIPLTQGLGIIEIGLPFLNLQSPRYKPNSIGKPLPRYEAELRHNQLFIRGPGMLDAYLSPWKTRSEILEDGWFRTGDMARVDSDGDFFLEGRAHSVINVAGMKCFPEEVEAILAGHPYVQRVRVTGRPHPKLGAVPVADIVPTQMEKPPSLASLFSLCRTSLARYKIPVEFRFVENLPLTASGKIKRAELP